MSPRYYTSCPDCHVRLRKVADEGSRRDRTARYYVCPGCGEQWTLLIDRNVLRRGIPDELERAAPQVLE